MDDGLVVETKEEIMEMNNGCICCTVRGDLIRILGKLMQRRDSFDYIIIETTGLADPAPVVWDGTVSLRMLVLCLTQLLASWHTGVYLT